MTKSFLESNDSSDAVQPAVFGHGSNQSQDVCRVCYPLMGQFWSPSLRPLTNQAIQSSRLEALGTRIHVKACFGERPGFDVHSITIVGISFDFSRKHASLQFLMGS